MNKTALITGGAGYIGHHLQKELKLQGYTVIVLDKNPREQMMSQKYCDQYIETDLTNVNRAFDDTPKLNVDIVFHLAGLIEVEESSRLPLFYYHNNVTSTINLLNLMQFRLNCDKIVFSSSAAVYGEYDLNPVSVYGRTKLMAETIMRDAEAEGIRSVALRYYNVAGADFDGEFGENHMHETHLIPKILNNNEFTVFGTDYPTEDGTCIRDYIHVADLAVAHIKAAEWLEDENNVSMPFDIGSGTGYSVSSILSTVEKVTGMTIDITYGDPREGDPASLIAITSPTEKYLKFKPKYNLEDIIKTAYQWEVIQKRKPL